MIGSFANASRTLRVLSIAVLILVGAGSFGAVDGARTAAAKDAPPPVLGTVYVFRPMGGRLATPEMENLARKIQARGLEADVFHYANWIKPAKAAVARYQAEQWKSAIILVGHSAGGDSAIRFARWLKRAGVPVNLIITLDPTGIAGAVPGKVERYLNVFSSGRALGSGDPQPAKDFAGHFASVDLHEYAILHRHFPGITGLQEAVVDKVAATAEQPLAVDGASVRIGYPVPRGSPIVLWDSGVPVAAEAGDTAASIAARYGVPAWAIAAINDVEPGRSFSSGQRVVVPRHLAVER
ncbi:LysM peptidoglycan-binding domain-containing protein [Bauldia sp.]|uniref:LysM peptidoglycan-binding domain-containing protein n=1 Tax=Bauldia sp. TaxID=2575872 RepID=UPI003BA99758